jgi:hypothetical protein
MNQPETPRQIRTRLLKAVAELQKQVRLCDVQLDEEEALQVESRIEMALAELNFVIDYGSHTVRSQSRGVK